jgi:hypothetical protein
MVQSLIQILANNTEVKELIDWDLETPNFQTLYMREKILDFPN